jgi:hypothetical protein
MKRALVVSVALLPAVGGADDVLLTGGGRLTGVIVERTTASITIDTGPGRVTLPMSRVVRVVARTADLALFRERAAQLAPGDVTGWLTLARWAEERALLTQAREAYAYVLSLDPQNAAAHRALGHVWMEDRWATLEESYRARGYMLFEGSWVAPEERRAILEDRMAAAAADRERIEAAARVREAEARVRIAEAEARRAEYAAEASTLPMDYPYGGFYGGGVYGSGYDPLAPYGPVLPPPPDTGVVVLPLRPPSVDNAHRPPRPSHQPSSVGGRSGMGPSTAKPRP